MDVGRGGVDGGGPRQSAKTTYMPKPLWQTDIPTNPMTDLPHMFFFQEFGFSVVLAHMATPLFRPLKRLRAKTLETDVTG